MKILKKKRYISLKKKSSQKSNRQFESHCCRHCGDLRVGKLAKNGAVENPVKEAGQPKKPKCRGKDILKENKGNLEDT